MTNSVSTSTFDVATVVGSTEGAIDGFDYVDGLPGLIDHPRASRVPAGAPLVVTGWALDRGTRGAAAAVRVVVDGIRQHGARTGLSRSDIVQVLDRPAGDERIGYRALVPTEGLPAGAHVVRAYALCAGGRWYEAGRYGFSVYEPLRPGAGATAGAVRLHVDQVIDVDRHGAIVAFGDAVPVGRFAMLSGWALDVAAGTGPAAVCATDDRGNRWTAPCELGRPDIRALMGAGDDRLGFELCIPARVFGRGRHVVRLGAVDHDGRPSEAALDVTVDVAAEQRPFPHGAHERAGTPQAACRLSFAPADTAGRGRANRCVPTSPARTPSRSRAGRPSPSQAGRSRATAPPRRTCSSS